MVETIVATTAVMFGLAALFSLLLFVANAKLAVQIDPRQRAIQDLLPQANCGGCGFASCAAYAKAVGHGQVPVDRCNVGGPAIAQQLATLLGVELTQNFPFRPVIHCAAKQEDRLRRGHYVGVPTCTAASVVGGVQGCTYGCLGFGDCVAACDFDAMELVDGLPRVNYENCTGCGACVRACPREIIQQIPFKVEEMLIVACANHDSGKAVREVCRVGCVGCGACARLEPELVSIEGSLAQIDYAKYSGKENVEKLVEKCPMQSLIVFGKPSPKHREQLDEVAAVTFAGRPALAKRSTADDLNWRG